MSDLTNIIKKELKELLTPGSVISVIIMVVMFAALGGLIGGEIEKASALPVVGIANNDDSVVTIDGQEVWNAYDMLIQIYSASGVDSSRIDEYVVPVEIPEGTGINDAMRDAGVSSLLVIDQDFSENVQYNLNVTDPSMLKQSIIWEYYIFEPTGMFGTVSSSTVSMLVSQLNMSLSAVLIDNKLDGNSCYEFVIQPLTYGNSYLNTIVNGEAHSGVTPQAITSEITNQTMMIPLVIMIVIMMVGSIVISSMGSEKENKTLETLLTLPIKRTTIVSGKITAAAIVGLVYGGAYMIGMSFYMGAMMEPMAMGVSLEDLGMGLGITDWVLIMVSMFLSIVCALGICMILGAFAKNYKSAQTMTMPLSILAMIPMFLLMFSGWYGTGPAMQAVVFAIPFSHPMMAMQSLMYGDLTLVFSGIAYMALFALASIAVTVKLYNSDILVTGLGQNSLVQKLTKKN